MGGFTLSNTFLPSKAHIKCYSSERLASPSGKIPPLCSHSSYNMLVSFAKLKSFLRAGILCVSFLWLSHLDET